jgi:hypothetical protein
MLQFFNYPTAKLSSNEFEERLPDVLLFAAIVGVSFAKGTT